MPRPPSHAPDRITMNIRALMGMVGVSQTALADALQMTQPQVSRRLRDGTWTIAEVDLLSRYFEVPIGNLFQDPRTLFDQGKASSGCITDIADEPVFPELLRVTA